MKIQPQTHSGKGAARAPDTAQQLIKVVVADPDPNGPVQGTYALVAGDLRRCGKLATTDTADPVVAAWTLNRTDHPRQPNTGTATIRSEHLTPDLHPAR